MSCKIAGCDCRRSQMLVAEICPFHNETNGQCRAAFSDRPIDSKIRNLRCSTEDYDGCPLFLARALRSSTPQARCETWSLHQK